jgi:hypothetical protein
LSFIVKIRRLAPASSILLRDFTTLDIVDDAEKLEVNLTVPLISCLFAFLAWPRRSLIIYRIYNKRNNKKVKERTKKVFFKNLLDFYHIICRNSRWKEKKQLRPESLSCTYLRVIFTSNIATLLSYLKCWWSFSSCMNYGSWEQVHLVISISMNIHLVMFSLFINNGYAYIWL